MPSRFERIRAAIPSSLACLAIVLAVPVCATLWIGGADWAVGDSMRLSWYDEGSAWWLLAGLVGWLLVASPGPPVALRPAPTLRQRLGRGMAALGLGFSGIVLGVLWSGGIRFAWLSLRSPEPSVWLAIALLTVSGFLLARPPRLITFLALLLSLSFGLLLQRALVSLDQRSMIRVMAEGVPEAPLVRPAMTPPDVLWIVVDTLRADALGVYAARGVPVSGEAATHSPTPFLDSLADRGVLFERALAAAPWTVPSMFSAFTSRWPSTLDPEGGGRARRADERIGLDRGVPSWVDSLREHGYHAAAFQKNPFLGEGSGLEMRFDLYRMVGGNRAEGESARQLVNAALRWADAMRIDRDSGDEGEMQPYLLYLHFMDPHIDYAPPAAWLPAEEPSLPSTIDGHARTLHRRLAEGPAISAAEGAHLARLYAAEVTYLDSELARLWAGLGKHMLVDSTTLVVVTGDHGEQFGEHGGWEHGDLFSENVHVPFLMAGGVIGASPRRVSESVSLLDLGPTVLGRLGLPALEGAEGKDLLGPGISASSPSSMRAIPSEYGARARLEFGQWVWVEGRGRAGAREGALYDRSVDPGEERDQSALRPEIAEQLREELAAHRARDRSSGERVRPLSRDRRLEEELEALGYGSPAAERR